MSQWMRTSQWYLIVWVLPGAGSLLDAVLKGSVSSSPAFGFITVLISSPSVVILHTIM